MTLLHRWIQKIFGKKNLKTEINQCCKNCIWWRADELLEPGKEKPKYHEYCGNMRFFTMENDSCYSFQEELFEATENSIQTKEFNMDLELEANFENDTFRKIT